MFQTAQEKLLILGCGDIGLRLVRQLSADHYLIQGVRRREIPHGFPNFTWVTADLYQPSSISAILKASTPDVILVTMTPDDRSDHAYKKAYVDTCQSLIENLRLLQQKPRLILFVSSTSVYVQDDGSWIDELSVTEPKTFSGQRLLEAETLLRTSDLPVLIVRFSGIYGPGRTRLNFILYRFYQSHPC
jgi:nucleoside-diphosphate-sugar epimerase